MSAVTLLLALAVLAPVSLAKSTFGFGDALSAATAHYNQISKESKAFKPPQKSPLLGMSMFIPGDGSSTEYTIRFTLKETLCPKSVDYKKEECAYKENGALLKCSSIVTVAKQRPGEADTVAVTCVEVTDPAERKKLEATPDFWSLFG
ncbi:cathelicidin antimicrobial peptide-like [Amia ocellicauda]|uniref:cathelicidin antimicrobial peptide-like n=1 Tax=Amia ocellicauda TaxID=2972642 RepID=UPI0034643CB5